MDHRHHPSSSTGIIKGGKDKRAKTAASSSSSSSAPTHAHGEADPEPLPPPPAPVNRLHFSSLADIAHDAISSYLTMKEIHYIMESSQWALKAYGGRVKELTVPCKEDENDGIGYARNSQGPQPTISTSAVVLSLINRRPGLVHVSVGIDPTLGVLVEAMKKGYCDRLQSISVEWWTARREPIQALCDALADGVCPKINKLSVPDIDDLLSRLGQALRSRMETGCSGLKSLEIESPSSSQSPIALSPLLSSGACEALEELRLDVARGGYNSDDLSEWLSMTKAPHLRVLTSDSVANMDVVRALCMSGVAPRLQVLHLGIRDPSCLALLSQTIGKGSWPHLTDLQIRILRNQGMVLALPKLVEAIRVGARELTNLKLCGDSIGSEGGKAVARMLRDGACPRLLELDLSKSDIRDVGVMELVNALGRGAPCNTTLRKLDLELSGITSVGMRELVQAMRRGALPHLEVVDLSSNSNIEDGVVALAGAVRTGRSLRSLRELHLGGVAMGERAAKALFQALRDYKPWPHMKVFNLSSSDGVGGGLVTLAEAIRAGALQQLQELYLPRVDMDQEEGFNPLIKAIVAQQPNPGCPRLEILDVSFGGDDGDIDGGVMYLAKMIKVEGAMQHLRELHISDVIMTGKGVRALFDALGDHACPHLEELKLMCILENYNSEIGCSHYLGNKFKQELGRKRKRDRRCSRVRVAIDYH